MQLLLKIWAIKNASNSQKNCRKYEHQSVAFVEALRILKHFQVESSLEIITCDKANTFVETFCWVGKSKPLSRGNSGI